MLTDDEVSEFNEMHGLSLRNFTQQQWRDNSALLPAGANPPREALFELSAAASNYWRDAAEPSMREQMRGLTKALERVREAMDGAYKNSPLRHEELTEAAIKLEWERDQISDAINQDRFFVSRGEPSRVDPRYPRRAVAEAAFELWRSCGGGLGVSHLPDQPWTPGGPLITYLKFVCDMVMGADTYERETLAAFVDQWKKDLLG